MPIRAWACRTRQRSELSPDSAFLIALGSFPPPGPNRVVVVSRPDRIFAGIVAAALLAVLVIAASLSPSARGHGTHEQLGLPACAYYVSTGHPCPTCGMTTAFAHAAHRQPVKAVITQPFGALLAVMTAAMFWGCLHVAAFGSRLGRVGNRLLRPRVLWSLVGLWAASWVYTMATWESLTS